MRLWPRKAKRQPGTALARVGGADRVPARHNPIRRELAILEKEQAEGVKAFERRESDGALVASGKLVTHGEASYLRRLIQPWQIRAFGYYDLLGEIKYAAQFYARALSNLDLYAAERNDKGELEPTDDQEVVDALDRIRDPGGGGRRGLLGDYGRLMFLTGESLLFVWNNPETEMEQWEMLSTDELRLLDGSYTRFLAPSLPAMQFRPAPDDCYVPVGQSRDSKGELWGNYDTTAVAYRLWKRHPRFSLLPDAPMEGVLELCEELVLLTHAVRARARSRLAGSGILFVDDRITTRPLEATPDEDVLEDPFLEDLTEAMTLPITDEGTASAVVPLLARVKVPDGMKLSDLVYHLQVVDPMQLYPETGLRMECVRRIAICLDMPPEVLLGLGTLNHWNVWGIDEQSWKYHLQPMAEHLVSDLTSAYLGPYLKKTCGRADWDKFCIAYDASKVINHPDRSKDAFMLHDRAVIGDEALRDATGFDADDAPTDEERARIIGMKVNDGSLAWFGKPAPRGGYVETAPGVVTQASEPPGGGGGSAPNDPSKPKPATPAAKAEKSTGASAEKSPPAAGPHNDDNVTGSALALVSVDLIAGAAYFGLLRAREAAGSRIRSLARRDPETLALIDGVGGCDVAATLGRARVRALAREQKDTNEEALIAAAGPLVSDAIRMFGVDDPACLAAITDAIAKHAVRTLYDLRPAPIPQGFNTYVTGLLSASKE